MNSERSPPPPSAPFQPNRNDGFIPPRRLNQLRKQELSESEQTNSRQRASLDMIPPNTSARESTSGTGNKLNKPPLSSSNSSSTMTPSAHTRSNSLFTSFRSRVSSTASKSNDNAASTGGPSSTRHQQHQSLSSSRPSGPAHSQSTLGTLDEDLASPNSTLAPQRLTPHRQESSTSTHTSATAVSTFGLHPPPEAQLHPEIQSVVSLTYAHAHKVYFSGPFIKRFEKQTDGHRPAKDEGWVDVWAQLGGTTLSIWNMAEIAEASKRGEEVPPSYINVTDAFVHVLGSVTVPATPTTPAQKYSNIVTVNTAGSNLYIFSCPSPEAVVAWASALRLAAWEKSRLEEIYTAHLLRISLRENGQWRDPASPLIHGKMEGWTRVRLAGQTDWKRAWLVVQAGSSDQTDGNVSATGSTTDLRAGSPSISRRHRMSNIFSRMHDHAHEMPARPSLTLYESAKPKDRKKVLLTMTDVTQVFAVYPERPELINRSTLIKVEGNMGPDESSIRNSEGWILMMPEVEPGKVGSTEMLKWLVAMHDAFFLYGRPQAYTWDPRDPVSMMFAYPVREKKEHLFLDRGQAETLDPRDERTPVVRANLKQILIDNLRAESPPPTARPPPDGRTSTEMPSVPPTGQTIRPVNGSPKPSAQIAAHNSDFTLPPLDFERTQPVPEPVSTPPTAGPSRTPLTPIIERSTLAGSSGSTRQGTGDTVLSSTSPTQQRPTSLSPQHGPQNLMSAPDSTIIHTEPTNAPLSSIKEVPLSGKMVTSPEPIQVPASVKATKQDTLSPQSAESIYSQDSFKGASNQLSFAIPKPMPVMEEHPEPADIQLPLSPRQSIASAASPPPMSYSPTMTPATSPPVSPPPGRPQMVDRSQRTLSAESADTVSSFLPTPSFEHPPNSFQNIQNLVAMSPELRHEGIDRTSPPEDRDRYATKPMPPVPSPAPPLPPKPNSPSSHGHDDIRSAPGAMYIMQQQQIGNGQSPRRQIVSSGSDTDSDSATDEQGGRAPNVAADVARASATAQAPVMARRPSGARQPPAVASPHPRFIENSSPSLAPRPSPGAMASATDDDDKNSPPPVHARDASFEDPTADALAALNFLEQHENSPKQTIETPSPKSLGKQPAPPVPQVVEPEDRAPTPPSGQYRSSFAPSKQAAERKARLQAQQAAHNEAVHRPGKPNGKSTQVRDRGAWDVSSDEEDDEGEEEDEEEDADSDEPQAPSRVGHGAAASSAGSHRAPASQAAAYQVRGPSPSRSAADLGYQQPQPRTSRVLPQIPDRRSPGFADEQQTRQQRYPSAQFSEGPRRTFMEENSRPSYPPVIHAAPDQPIPGAARQNNMWSAVLDAKAAGAGPVPAPGSQNTRDTFIQLDNPAETLTKAFTPQGLLSAGLQDKEDRSAKKQELLARESGSSLINVPNKPPPPQTGLLGVVAAHERERKREGGMGAALTERERERRHAEEQQRKLDEFQRQQQMMQGGGSMYGMYGGGLTPQVPAGYNPLMGAPFGAPSPMVPSMYFNPMMGPMSYPNPQQMYAAQQAAQAYHQAMMSMSVAGSQIAGSQMGGEDGNHMPMNFPPSSPGPMMGQPNMNMPGMGMGMGFDPRMSMMGMGMMSPMGMPGMMPPTSPMGSPMGMPMNGANPAFDPRFSMGTPNYDNMRPFASPGPGGYHNNNATPPSGDSNPVSTDHRGPTASDERARTSEGQA